MTVLSLLGYACGLGAGNTGCADGPLSLQNSDLLIELANGGITAQWAEIFKPIAVDSAGLNKTWIIQDICNRLAGYTQRLTQNRRPFAVLGGDHTCAIGTWSGVAAAVGVQDSIGLIWIDAHMDSHTPETTPSGNLHGMPLAVLLGYGDRKLTQLKFSEPKLKPENVVLIGVRSYESGEAGLLNRLGVRIYTIREIQDRGISVVLNEAVKQVRKNTVGFGMSLDLDAIDPKEAPGVGNPELNGINAQGLCEAFSEIFIDGSLTNNLLGIELAEFNPHQDDDQKQTARWIKNIIISLLGKR